MPGTFRSGRRREPTSLKLLRGGEVRGRGREPKYEYKEPEVPTQIMADALALQHWRRLVKQLSTAGVLNVSHGDALGALAHALADYGRIREQLHQMNYQQLLVDESRDSTGKIVIRRRVRENPLLRRSERIALLVSRLLGEFGLTPVTQSRVDAYPNDREHDPFEAFLIQGRPR